MELFELSPALTYQALLIIQAVHLIHHRIAKRHVSFVEGITAIVLCLPPAYAEGDAVKSWLLMGAHAIMGGIQIVGSIFIQRLSPNWTRG